MMEITKREILFSTIILCVMIGLGVLISRPILANATSNALKTISAVQVKDSAKFDYIRRTDVGDFLAEGKLITVDPVSIDDIKGKYSKIEKHKEEYTMHTRTVTETDDEGHTHTYTETYWEWDVVQRWQWESTTVKFLGYKTTPKAVGYRFNTRYQETIDPKEGLFATDIRYKYYTCPTEVYGVLSGNATNKSFLNLNFKKDGTIEKIVNTANSNMESAPVVFWVLWTLFTAGLILLFYYAENNWLEDDRRKEDNREHQDISW